VQIRSAVRCYTNIGIYKNESIVATTNRGGFSSPDRGLNDADGTIIPLQLAFQTTLYQPALTSTLRRCRLVMPTKVGIHVFFDKSKT
jgi:hypothetical protein